MDIEQTQDTLGDPLAPPSRDPGVSLTSPATRASSSALLLAPKDLGVTAGVVERQSGLVGKDSEQRDLVVREDAARDARRSTGRP